MKVRPLNHIIRGILKIVNTGKLNINWITAVVLSVMPLSINNQVFSYVPFFNSQKNIISESNISYKYCLKNGILKNKYIICVEGYARQGMVAFVHHLGISRLIIEERK